MPANFSEYQACPTFLSATSFFAARAARCHRRYRAHALLPPLYASPYPLDFLHRTAAAVAATPGVGQAYVYFNNDIGGSAIGKPRTLPRLIKKPHPLPPFL